MGASSNSEEPHENYAIVIVREYVIPIVVFLVMLRFLIRHVFIPMFDTKLMSHLRYVPTADASVTGPAAGEEEEEEDVKSIEDKVLVPARGAKSD